MELSGVCMFPVNEGLVYVKENESHNSPEQIRTAVRGSL
jgi:hypothetical protein